MILSFGYCKIKGCNWALVVIDYISVVEEKVFYQNVLTKPFFFFFSFFFFFQKKTKGEEVLEKVFIHLNVLEKDYFGLRYIDRDSQSVCSFFVGMNFISHGSIIRATEKNSQLLAAPLIFKAIMWRAVVLPPLARVEYY